MKTYYVWADDHCDNCTEDYNQAVQWGIEFVNEGKENVYITDENNDLIFVVSE
jgi:hypothetical protein